LFDDGIVVDPESEDDDIFGTNIIPQTGRFLYIY